MSSAELRERATSALETMGLTVAAPAADDAPIGLARLLGESDVAVSSAGVTAYELACAGVPAVLVPVADNQRRVVRAFVDAGLALTSEPLEEALTRLAEGTTRSRLAQAGPGTVDGYGAARARDALSELWDGRRAPRILNYRPAGLHDSGQQLAWRNEAATREASWNRAPVAPDEHTRWFAALLEDAARTLLIVEEGGSPVGSVRFDRDGDESAVSLVVGPEHRGAGIGTQAVREASELELSARPAVRCVRAAVRSENAASLALFDRAGFRARLEDRPGGRTLVLDRAALASRRR